MKRVIDVSLGVGPDLPTWPGDPGVEVVPTARLARGDQANVSELRMGSHTGTHVDPPVHFIDGEASIDALPLETLVGTAVVADLRGSEGIGPAELDALDLRAGVERLLCRTDNSDRWASAVAEFPDDYVAITPDGARWIAERGLRLVGVDFLSVERDGPPDFPVHRTLLGAGVIVVEGLDLSKVEPGPYTLVCAPLKVIGGDGAPARALLIES
ncbi:MAG TPA: cyclase family protein [Actinomycetota bacterium]|nr:cyclase family protein [Actinomycetota bacterium]